MSEKPSGKTVPVIEPCIRFTPAEVVRHKLQRDARRKSIRGQNARSKTMR